MQSSDSARLRKFFQLFHQSAFADSGFTIKRFRPAAKGRAASRYKRCSHITIAVAKI